MCFFLHFKAYFSISKDLSWSEVKLLSNHKKLRRLILYLFLIFLLYFYIYFIEYLRVLQKLWSYVSNYYYYFSTVQTSIFIEFLLDIF